MPFLMSRLEEHLVSKSMPNTSPNNIIGLIKLLPIKFYFLHVPCIITAIKHYDKTITLFWAIITLTCWLSYQISVVSYNI